MLQAATQMTTAELWAAKSVGTSVARASAHGQPHHRPRHVEPSRFAALAGGITNSAEFCLRLEVLRKSPNIPTYSSTESCAVTPDFWCGIPHFAFRPIRRNQVSPHHLWPGRRCHRPTNRPTSHQVPQPCAPLGAVSKREDAIQTAGNHHKMRVGQWPHGEKAQRAFSAATNRRHLPTVGVPTGRWRLSGACSAWCLDWPRLAVLEIPDIWVAVANTQKSRKAVESDDGRSAAETRSKA